MSTRMTGVITTLYSKIIDVQDLGQRTISQLESDISGMLSSLTIGVPKKIKFVVYPASGVFDYANYVAFVIRTTSTKLSVLAYIDGGLQEIIGSYYSNAFHWDEVALNSKVTKSESLNISVKDAYAEKVTISNNNSFIYQDTLMVIAVVIQTTDTITSGEKNMFSINHRPIRGLSGCVIDSSNSGYVGTFFISGDVIYLNFTNEIASGKTLTFHGVAQFYQ